MELHTFLASSWWTVTTSTYNVHCILHCINFINTQAAYVVVKKISLVLQIICQKQRKHDIWTKNTNLRKPWWTYCTKLFEKINYSLKVSAFFSLIAFNCIAESCHYINQTRDNKWLCDTVKSYKTKKSETLRLEFTFSILLSKVKKAFMELYQNVFKGLSQSNVFGGQIHSASV